MIAFLLRRTQHPYRQKLRKSIRNRVASYWMSIWKPSLGLMRMVREMYRDVADIRTVEVPEEFFEKTFIRYVMLGTGQASRRNELVDALHEKCPKYRFEGTRSGGRNSNVYTYEALKYLMNLRNHVIMIPEHFTIRSIFALYSCLSRKGIWNFINGITNDSQLEQEIEFVDK